MAGHAGTSLPISAAAGIDEEIVPGILPVSNVAQTRKFAGMCGAEIPGWMDRLFEGLDDHPAARQLVAAAAALFVALPAPTLAYADPLPAPASIAGGTWAC